jgi:hypothetical protein
METAAFDTADGLYDCAWSEENENILLAASGDGSVKVYDLAAPPMANPLRVFREHKHEVSMLLTSCTCIKLPQLACCMPTVSLAAYAHLQDLSSSVAASACNAAYWCLNEMEASAAPLTKLGHDFLCAACCCFSVAA